MNNTIMAMIKTEIIEKVNHRIKDDGFWLINPPSAELGPDGDGLLWLVDQTGRVVLQNIDVFEHSEGFDLVKSDVLWGFNDYIANLCDTLLIMAGVDLIPVENPELSFEPIIETT